MKLTHINPDSLHKNPAFSQAILVENAEKMLFIGGQNAVDKDGNIVGKDLQTQTEQALNNILGILKSVNATQENVVSMRICVVQGQDINEGYAAAQKIWGMHPTTLSFMFVSGLAHPDYLVEIEITAVI